MYQNTASFWEVLFETINKTLIHDVSEESLSYLEVSKNNVFYMPRSLCHVFYIIKVEHFL